jgi:hypothetical protein
MPECLGIRVRFCLPMVVLGGISKALLLPFDNGTGAWTSLCLSTAEEFIRFMSAPIVPATARRLRMVPPDLTSLPPAVRLSAPLPTTTHSICSSISIPSARPRSSASAVSMMINHEITQTSRSVERDSFGLPWSNVIIRNVCVFASRSYRDLQFEQAAPKDPSLSPPSTKQPPSMPS